VLLYHAIRQVPRSADPIERDLFVHPDEFAWQMSDLAARRYRTLTLDEYEAALSGSPQQNPSVLLSFDDAYEHIDDVVTPILRRYGFSAVVFAPWEHLGRLNSWDDDHAYLAHLRVSSRDQLRSMSAGLWEVASHGLCHVDLSTVAHGQLEADLRLARESLGALIGGDVHDLAYPYGVASRKVRRAAQEAGYRMAFMAGPAQTGDRFQLPRRPIRGSDSRAVFRLKTSSWGSWYYRQERRAPGWARSSARTLLNIAGQGMRSR
jgi:peptidoglycan/xylan/chitin deacetylase (PgdA/CDA1 family)